MNSAVWVNDLPRAKLSQKYAFQAIHILAPHRNAQGIAPVVLQTEDAYLRAPVQTEACFELCLRHLNRLQVPWPAQESLTAMNLLADRASQALKLPNRFVPMPDNTVEDLSESNAPPPSPVCAKEDMREDTTLCAMHVDVTASPGWLEPSSNVASPMSQTLPLISAEWPQDLQALLENTALPTDSADLPHDTAMCADSCHDAAMCADSCHDACTDLLDSPHNIAAMRADLPLDNAALCADFPHDTGALRVDSPHNNATMRIDFVTPRAESPRIATPRADSLLDVTTQRADSPRDIATQCADSPHDIATSRADSPQNHTASDAAPGTRSMSRRARRRAVLRARKQQQQR